MVMELVSWLLAGCAGNLIPAYYGGEARCDQEVGIQGDYDPTELVCGACSDVSRAQMCPKHGTDFLEYNCRYCRSVAVFFCFGRPHISAMLATMTYKGSPAFQSQIFLTALLSQRCKQFKTLMNLHKLDSLNMMQKMDCSRDNQS
ncbi:uncharacterized protein [Asterias amurensis]|uniref:uncharacterized protein n=1 Tax=Asterias amurensis TaxID=7602 RepID=UPI003AB710A2